MTVSLGARAFVLLLRLTRRRELYTSVEGLMRGIAVTRRAGPARPSESVRRRLDVELGSFQDRDVYRLRPQQVTPSAARVLYLHGGAYVRPITHFHWHAIADLVERTGIEFVVPLYPLAPEARGMAALDFVNDLYQCESSSGARMVLMGDSAGAGLALALASALRDGGARLPRRLVLLSPCVDAVIAHPDAIKLAADDPMLGLVGGREALRLYAGPLGTSHEVPRPARGKLEGLPPMTLFVGSRDILAPDAVDYARKARASGCDVDLRVSHGMFHVWALLGFAEAKATRKEMADEITSAFGISGAGNIERLQRAEAVVRGSRRE